jgi:imidazolonepropionase-like amidohydrolase
MDVPVTFRADRRRGWVIAVTLFCGSAVAGGLRIDHVTIVSAERASPLRDVTVYIRGERITSIYRSKLASAAHRTETNVDVIDGEGLYLSPGLIDSHVHTGGVPGMGPAQERANPEVAKVAREQVPRLSVFWIHHAH